MAGLNPRLSSNRYSYREGADATLPPEGFALIREDEGMTLITHDPDGDWARISLGIHSSLNAVGLTAELSRRLAAAGISANVVAGLRHDHFFVPWERREEALALLR